MTIGEMHVWFRQYAQQMGMQNVRAILPEQIDLLINTSITDTVNQLIKDNISATNDRVITDNSKIGQINAFRTLYKVKEVSMNLLAPPGVNTPFKKGSESFIKRYYAKFADIKEQNGEDFTYMFLVDFAINYNIGVGSTAKTTNWYPVRLIDDAFLADTLQDYVLKPRFRSPISVIYNDQVDVYIDDENSALANTLTPNKFRISYVAYPNKVLYAEDIEGVDSVNCDLPPSMHVDILKHAVDLYRISVSGALSGAQRQQQAQQAENARNNYRNEGTQ